MVHYFLRSVRDTENSRSYDQRRNGHPGHPGACRPFSKGEAVAVCWCQGQGSWGHRDTSQSMETSPKVVQNLKICHVQIMFLGKHMVFIFILCQLTKGYPWTDTVCSTCLQPALHPNSMSTIFLHRAGTTIFFVSVSKDLDDGELCVRSGAIYQHASQSLRFEFFTLKCRTTFAVQGR